MFKSIIKKIKDRIQNPPMHKCHWNDPLCVNKPRLFGCICGKGETVLQAAPTTPAPSATESAADIMQARLQYDPQMAAQQMQQQQQYMPQQAALYQALYNQYMPQMAQTQQQTQQQLYPFQSQIVEQGAQQALFNLGQPENALLQALGQQAQAGLTPTGYTSEQQQSIDAIRMRQATGLSRQLRERSNIGGTLYGGRSQQLESQGLQELAQRFSAEDIDRITAQRQVAMQQAQAVSAQQMQARQAGQQALNPYMQILYPQVGTQQPQISPFQYQSAVPSADALYNAMAQARQPQYFASQKYNPSSDIMGLGGQLGGAGMMALALSSIRYKKNIKEWGKH